MSVRNSGARRVAVLGDSTIDCKKYVGESNGVIEWLGELLGNVKLDVGALDGGVAAGVYNQVVGLEHDEYDTVVLSVGGNDGMGCIGKLLEPISGFDAVVRTFEQEYTEACDAIAELAPSKVVLCTVYHGDFKAFGQEFEAGVRTGVRLYNEVIYRTAAKRGWDVLELREVTFLSKHFTANIEPSALGAERIAKAITREVCSDEYDEQRADEASARA